MSSETEGHEPSIGDALVRPRPRPLGPGLSPRRLGRWTAELISVPGGLVDSYLPARRGVGARTREQIIVAVSEQAGDRVSVWVHGAWLDFIGARDPDEALGPLFDYARACAEAGRPIDTTTLEASYPAAVVRSVRATVAVASIGNLVTNTGEELLARVQGHRSGFPFAALPQALAVGASIPLMAPALALAGTMKVLNRMAPELPRIDTPPARDANLVVHLLAEAAPSYLGHAFVRTSLVWSPVPVAVAFRMEGVSATIRLGRGNITISNGVTPDAVAVVEGGVERLLQMVAGSILREFAAPVRRAL